MAHEMDVANVLLQDEIPRLCTNEELKKRKTEPAQVKTAIDNFEKCIVDVRNKIDDIINEAKSICTEPQGIKRRRRNNSSHDHRVAALEVCDNIVNFANDRFQFKDHLVAASLFFVEHIGEYCELLCQNQRLSEISQH
ncbi:unnamed protein product [Acanthoscelides obtectus]|uniref:Uncharacterized protein n=1 Tax=Acanthoscelides obtectus TaxID=200917 RepID=A0A9P0NYM1_ACAOB|nr:unnamed protein product [Acanthoscelides obtectus]CAK1625415.1 hypothetical protein AOBTE_LOCUS3151 [Acanthoscelides obtectus]